MNKIKMMLKMVVTGVLFLALAFCQSGELVKRSYERTYGICQNAYHPDARVKQDGLVWRLVDIVTGDSLCRHGYTGYCVDKIGNIVGRFGPYSIVVISKNGLVYPGRDGDVFWDNVEKEERKVLSFLGQDYRYGRIGEMKCIRAGKGGNVASYFYTFRIENGKVYGYISDKGEEIFGLSKTDNPKI
ncbi:MAG: hypothetical protein NTZ80_01115 [Patescibacteria group bacterium]|nr:hypothetical protein [Patescibacteria group bacterium]